MFPAPYRTGQADVIYVYQIIEEELPFPSGTATAHLISVLHQLPPPESGPRHRTGYQHIDDEEETAISEEIVNNLAHDDNTGAGEESEREIVEHEGWQDLIWSFTASGLLTVCPSKQQLYPCVNVFHSASSIFLSHRIRNSVIWQLSS